MADAVARRHAAPGSNREYDFFYEGLEREELLIQQCDECQIFRNPPSPMCGNCNSLKWTGRRVSGQGTVHSYTVHYHPPLPGFASPHPVALIQFEEGVRMVGAMDGTDPADVVIGAHVEPEFLRRGEIAAVRFRIAR